MYLYPAVLLWLKILFSLGLTASIAPTSGVGSKLSKVVGRQMPSRAPGRPYKLFGTRGGPRGRLRAPNASWGKVAAQGSIFYMR